MEKEREYNLENDYQLEDLTQLLSLPKLQTLECHNLFASPVRFGCGTHDRYNGRPAYHTLRRVYLYNSDLDPCSLYSFARLLPGLDVLVLEFKGRCEGGCKEQCGGGCSCGWGFTEAQARCKDHADEQSLDLCHNDNSNNNKNSSNSNRSYNDNPNWMRYWKAFLDRAGCIDGATGKAEFRMTFGINSQQREFLELKRRQISASG